MNDLKEEPPASCFPTTQWTRIIETIQEGAHEKASAALEEFCTSYRSAIYKFFRRRRCTHEQAEDYTHEFFRSRIFMHWDDRDGFLHQAQRSGRGKFRSVLCHVLWRFLQDEWKQQLSARAGGALPHVPLEGLDLADTNPGQQDFAKFGSEFDRVFALEMIQKAAERSKHSQYLLAHFRGEMSQQEAAKELGLSENAFKQAYHRFRLRLGQDLWEEVVNLVGPDEQEVRAELEYLISLFARLPA